jgi:hypothetical protein
MRSYHAWVRSRRSRGESGSIDLGSFHLCSDTTFHPIQTLDTQGLLDPSDSSLDFVAKRENVRPVAIYRVEENFLLCYAGELRCDRSREVFCLADGRLMSDDRWI